MNLVNQIGVDRIVLSNIGVVSIDEAMLEAVADANGKDIVHILRNDNRYSKDGKQEIRYITIKDNTYFGTFKIHHIMSTERLYETRSAVMDFTVCGEYANLQNMSAEELHDRVGFLETYLYDVYGINARFEDAYIRDVEVNVTIPLEGTPALIDDFPFYKMLLANLPNAGNLQAQFGTQKDPMKYSTCMRKNGSKQTSFYDKGMQLKAVHGIHVTSHALLRIEVELLGTEAVKRMMGTNKLYELNQDILNGIFKKEIIDKIQRLYTEYFDTREGRALRLLKKYRSRDNRWPSRIVQVIREQHGLGKLYLLDVAAFKPACSKLVGSKHANDTYRRIQARSNEYPLMFQGLDLKFAYLVYMLNRALDGDQTTELTIKTAP